jgi:hypothetical protein
MQRPKTLAAFSAKEYRKAHKLLATRVAFMMGRKFEEGDWAQVYCTAKNIPNRGWSNLNIDVIHNGLGVEHKMLRPNGDRPVRQVFGMRLMHPSATRSIRISDGDPNIVMRDVLKQYADFLAQRKEYVRQNCPGFEPDMRIGWVLWQSNLKEFVYFEEETLAPDPDDYIAEWHQNPERGGRKESKSLWIFEKETRQKKFSVTTTAGAKIQPYFDVPPSSDPNVYFFKVQGEEYRPGLTRVWVSASTAHELERLLGKLSAENLHRVITDTASQSADTKSRKAATTEEATPLVLTVESYKLLESYFPNAVSDAHMMQLLLERLSKRTR